VDRTFDLTEYNEEKSLKLSILKIKRYGSLWYEHLDKNRASEAKLRIKTCSKLKKHVDILPSSHKETLYLTLLEKRFLTTKKLVVESIFFRR